MLFKTEFIPGIIDGTITLTFRNWKRPQARAGGRYRFGPDDVLFVDAVTRVRAGTVSDAEAQRSGFASAEALRAELRATKSTSVYRIAFHDERSRDTRAQAAQDDRLTVDDIELILARLARMDRNGAWTGPTLELIAKRPGIVSTELAKQLGQDRAVFKTNVRKLKALGLTISLEIGYEPSPRGVAYLESLRTRRKTR